MSIILASIGLPGKNHSSLGYHLENQNPRGLYLQNPRYNGPIYFPNPIYNMLNEDTMKELDKYCQEKKTQHEHACNRMAKEHEQDHEEADSPRNPEPDLENHFHEDSYPMQDTDIEDLLEIHGQYSANMASTYHISKHSVSSYGSLVDKGANGGLAGADVHVLERTGRKVSVTGIDDHELPGLDIVTCVTLIQTNHGRVNMLMHEYAYMVEAKPSTLRVRLTENAERHFQGSLLLL